MPACRGHQCARLHRTWRFHLQGYLGPCHWPMSMFITFTWQTAAGSSRGARKALERKHWRESLAEKDVAKKTWPERLAHKLGPQTWPTNLAQKLGPETWPRKLGLENWEGNPGKGRLRQQRLGKKIAEEGKRRSSSPPAEHAEPSQDRAPSLDRSAQSAASLRLLGFPHQTCWPPSMCSSA